MLGGADCRTKYRVGVQGEPASPCSRGARWYSPAQAHLLAPADGIKPSGPVDLLNPAAEISAGSQPANSTATTAMQMSLLFSAAC